MELIMNKRVFGKTENNEAYLISLSSGSIKADVTNYGCAVVRLMVPDKSGTLVDVVMGFDTLEEYVNQKYYVGAVLGRCANRITNARFTINGEEYLLDKNKGENHLHGGRKGFWNVLWEIEEYDKDYVIFKYLSADGEEGYPGNLECTVEYRIVENQLRITYKGISDKDTVLNLTNHSYFNLNGHGNGTVVEHIVSIDADAITEIDTDCCSTGKILPVEDTPFDLRSPKIIGHQLLKKHDQMEYGAGFNHNFILNHQRNINIPIACLFSNESGIEMKVFTEAEGVHFYTGNYLDGTLRGKNGVLYKKHSGLCFETQHYPNAINIKHFPSPIIRKGMKSESTTIFSFRLHQ